MELLDSSIVGILICDICDREAPYLVMIDCDSDLGACEQCLLEALGMFPSDSTARLPTPEKPEVTAAVEQAKRLLTEEG